MSESIPLVCVGVNGRLSARLGGTLCDMSVNFVGVKLYNIWILVGDVVVFARIHDKIVNLDGRLVVEVGLEGQNQFPLGRTPAVFAIKVARLCISLLRRLARNNVKQVAAVELMSVSMSIRYSSVGITSLSWHISHSAWTPLSLRGCLIAREWTMCLLEAVMVEIAVMLIGVSRGRR